MVKTHFVLAVVVLVVVILILSACGVAPTATPIGARGYIYQQSEPERAAVPQREAVQRWHDDTLAVTCWLFNDFYGKGIACLPDVQLRDPAWWKR